MALINAFNMLDGMDGLAGGVALAAFAGLAVLASIHGANTSLQVCVCMIGALSAFLLLNVPVSYNRSVRTFMGDAGSTLLGFLLSGLALTLVQSDRANVSPVCILWMLPIPVFELFSSTVRRLRRGQSPLAADRGHFHHRLMDAGFSVRAIFFAYFTFSVLSVAMGVTACRQGLADSQMFASYAALFVVWKLFIRSAPRFTRYLPHGWHREHQNWA